MKKLTLAGVSYDVLMIEELPFLIPTRLQKFERPIAAKLRDAVALLKNKGWYEYVLMADFPTVVAHSRRGGEFALLFGGVRNAYRRVFFTDSGRLLTESPTRFASDLVHEATHVFQWYYFSGQEYKSRRARENDACREQTRFRARCGKKEEIRHIRDQLRASRAWWGYLVSKPMNRTERYNEKRRLHCRRVRNDLIPHISF